MIKVMEPKFKPGDHAVYRDVGTTLDVEILDVDGERYKLKVVEVRRQPTNKRYRKDETLTILLNEDDASLVRGLSNI